MFSFKRSLIALVGLLVLVAQVANTAPARKQPTPIGAWFGIARPCPADPVADSAAHAVFCRTVCGLCPSAAGVLPPEVPMMPTLLADGTVLADDAGEISRFHTTAHGKWTVSENDGLTDIPGTTRYRATFFWLGSGTDGVFSNSVRPRFVTYFDPADPDRMLGYIQPYLFPIAPEGTVIVSPPTDPLEGNHIPLLDPLKTLPEGCVLEQGCLGTYHFVIRRIKVE